MTETRTHDYTHDGQAYEGYLALPEGGPAPLVLVCHAWGGLGDNERGKCQRLADAGYAAFALDVYGKGKRGSSPEENEALMTPLVQDRAMLRDRLAAGVEASKTIGGVKQEKRAAAGYCFGGLCVLDMARAGLDVAGVASFHGLLNAPAAGSDSTITAKVAMHHGWQDPMAPPEDVLAVAREMSDRGADWQLHAYGKALHSFTTEGANNPDMGTVYDADADRRSWHSFMGFLDEVLGG